MRHESTQSYNHVPDEDTCLQLPRVSRPKHGTASLRRLVTLVAVLAEGVMSWARRPALVPTVCVSTTRDSKRVDTRPRTLVTPLCA